ncbi:MAG: aminoglycoside phosphotransferase family protein, partial [Gemmatimonadetes bacterium]|nr:aminoglycoside phosphotransferase family protein [Gemmatimonadota bacterium]
RFVVRAFADDRGARVLAGLRALSAAGIRVTPPLGYHADRRALVCDWLEGECLADRIDRDDAGDAIERTARLLARTREVSLPANVFAAPRTAADIHREAASVLADLGDVAAGDVADAARELAAALPDPRVDRAPRRSVPQHGDLHHRQVLVEEGDVSLLDWDELTLADPHEDVANFVAHLDLLVLERRLAPERAARFERRFVDASGLDAAAVAELVAPQLAKLALVPFRNLRGDWETETRAILERSLERAVRPAVRCSR